jgi:hypothetical protein
MPEHMGRELFVWKSVIFQSSLNSSKRERNGNGFEKTLNFHALKRNPLLQLRPDLISHPNPKQVGQKR